MHHISEMVRKDLNFNMARVLEEFLHVDLGIIESGRGLSPGGRYGVNERCLRMNYPHTAPSTPA